MLCCPLLCGAACLQAGAVPDGEHHARTLQVRGQSSGRAPAARGQHPRAGLGIRRAIPQPRNAASPLALCRQSRALLLRPSHQLPVSHRCWYSSVMYGVVPHCAVLYCFVLCCTHWDQRPLCYSLYSVVSVLRVQDVSTVKGPHPSLGGHSPLEDAFLWAGPRALPLHSAAQQRLRQQPVRCAFPHTPYLYSYS